MCVHVTIAGEQNRLSHEEERRRDPSRRWKNQCKEGDFKIGRVAEGLGGSEEVGEGRADMEINNSGAFRAA